MCKKNDKNLKCYTTMMGKRDFYKLHEIQAFELATRLAGESYDHSHYRTQHIAAEANLILDEWWRDYQEEHV